MSEFQVAAAATARSDRVLVQSAVGRQTTVGGGEEQPSGSGRSGILVSRTTTHRKSATPSCR